MPSERCAATTGLEISTYRKRAWTHKKSSLDRPYHRRMVVQSHRIVRSWFPGFDASLCVGLCCAAAVRRLACVACAPTHSHPLHPSSLLPSADRAGGISNSSSSQGGEGKRSEVTARARAQGSERGALHPRDTHRNETHSNGDEDCGETNGTTNHRRSLNSITRRRNSPSSSLDGRPRLLLRSQRLRAHRMARRLARWIVGSDAGDAVEAHREEVDAKDAAGVSALSVCCEEGHADCVDELIKAGARVDQADAAGCTVLMHAAEAGSVDCMQLLFTAAAANDDADLNINSRTAQARLQS